MQKLFGLAHWVSLCLKPAPLFGVALLIGCAAIRVQDESSLEVSEWIGAIATEKSKCEQWAALFKSYKVSSPKEVTRAAELYIDAKSAFDGWIEQFKHDLMVGADVRRSEKYGKLIKASEERCATFIQYVRGTDEIRTRGDPASMIGGLLGSNIFHGGVRIWESYLGII